MTLLSSVVFPDYIDIYITGFQMRNDLKEQILGLVTKKQKKEVKYTIISNLFLSLLWIK